MQRRLIGLAAACVLLPAADLLACVVLQHRMQAEYAAWVETISKQGWSIHAAQIANGGYPFGATLTMTRFDLAGGHAMLPGGLDWQADRVVLSLTMLHPWRLTVEPQGQQVVRIAGMQPVSWSADMLVASVPLGHDQADSIAIKAAGVVAGVQTGRDRADYRLDHLSLRLAARLKGAARIDASAAIDASGVELPDDGRWPLGALVRHAAAQISLASPALSGVAAADQARAWHDWGGVLTVQNLAVLWGPLDLRANAHMGLDDALQPAGEGHAVVKGWAETVDALSAGGLMPEGVGQTVKIVMGLMAKSSDGGLTVPFKLKDSTLSVGKIPLVKLRPVDWSTV